MCRLRSRGVRNYYLAYPRNTEGRLDLVTGERRAIGPVIDAVDDRVPPDTLNVMSILITRPTS
jgi:hypothetical protein